MSSFARHSIAGGALLVLVAGAAGQPCIEGWLPQFMDADVDALVWCMLTRQEAGQQVLYLGGGFNQAGLAQGAVVRLGATGFEQLSNPPFQGSARTMVFFDADGPGPEPEALHVGGGFTWNGLNRIAKLVNGTWQMVAPSGAGGLPSIPDALAVFDDGTGEALYVVGDLNGIWKLVGDHWEVLGSCSSGYALAVFDPDGPGPASPRLFAAGNNWQVGPPVFHGIVSWDGSQWSNAGTVVGTPWSLESFDADGSGPALPLLFLGGQFTSVGGVAASHIARWNGQSWAAVGGGLVNTLSTIAVLDMQSVDEDGAGPQAPALFVCGEFTSAGGTATKNIAAWRNGAWTGFPSGPPDRVRAIGATSVLAQDLTVVAGGEFLSPGVRVARLTAAGWRALSETVVGTITRIAAFTLNNAPRLYVGGQFTHVGGGAVPAPHIAAWDGVQWESMGNGVNGDVMSFAVHDRGQGPELYAGGEFSQTGGFSTAGVASFDGEAWTPLGGGIPGTVRDAKVFDDDGPGPNPPVLFVGGGFNSAGGVTAINIAQWNGSAWSPAGPGLPGQSFGTPGVHMFEIFDDGTGPSLFIGGAFTTTLQPNQPIRSIARWQNKTFVPVGGGTGTTGGREVFSLKTHDDGSGEALFAGGYLTSMGGQVVSGIARWNGASWASVGSGISGGTYVNALESHDDGSGLALYAAGRFTGVGGVPAMNIGRWQNNSWSAVGGGLILGTSSGEVHALRTFDDGSGPALYAAGAFNNSGPAFIPNIAKWNGQAWMPLGNGLNQEAYSLDVYDAGTGPALYIGGAFQTFSGFTSPGLVRWTGSAFEPPGGVAGQVHSLAAYDLGAGSSLLIGGSFTVAGIQSVNNIARWDGVAWTSLGTGPNGAVRTMTSFDPDGAGAGAPALFAAGFFSQAGGVPASCIAGWSGASWSALGAGVSGGIRSILGFDDGSGPALYAAGSFTSAGGLATRGIARWSQAAGWALVGNAELNGSSSQAYALAVYNDGAGPAIYMGGEYTSIHTGAQAVEAKNIARWSGSEWSVVGEGFNFGVQDLAVLDIGPGAFLYATGGFTLSGQTAVSRIARWNGLTWAPLDTGLNFGAHTLAAFEDALGRAVYVAGSFTKAGGISSKNLARWGCAPDVFGCYIDCNGDSAATIADFACFQNRFILQHPYADCNQSGGHTIADFGCFQTAFVAGCP